MPMAHRLYDTARWKRLRKLQLSHEPLCRLCRQQGRTEPADTADHITPHKGDPELFWDMDNLQSLCTPCHSAVKQSEERTGVLRGCGADGVPLDGRHHWTGHSMP